MRGSWGRLPLRWSPSPSHDGITAVCEPAKVDYRMQNRDGGWGAFDKDNDSEFLCRVPFADHNAMIDPSTPDHGRTIEPWR
jgi:squalene-hopene/tetraprenyl-beta-curcumene cyclase